MNTEQVKGSYPEIIVPASGKPVWYGGAYTTSFVYSNKGNFILKGYMKEVEAHLEKLKNEGVKYFVNHVLWHKKESRNIWDFYKNSIGIHAPSKHYSQNGKDIWTKHSRKFRIFEYSNLGESKTNRKELFFKRLPKNWIPELDQL